MKEATHANPTDCHPQRARGISGAGFNEDYLFPVREQCPKQGFLVCYQEHRVIITVEHRRDREERR
jgi:hypothetical protein